MVQEASFAGDAKLNYSESADIESRLELARPWPRFWARSFDMIFYILVLGAALGIIFPEIVYIEVFQGRIGDYFLTLLLFPVAMLLDAVVLAQFGTSLGKKIAGLSIVPDEGADRSMEVMIRRNLGCYIRGMALGIPLVSLFTYIRSYQRVEAQGTTSWDDYSQTKVVSVPNEGGRTIVIATCFVVLNALFSALDLAKI